MKRLMSKRRRRPIRKTPGTIRVMDCSWCGEGFKTLGTMRVLRFVVFVFCARCWTGHKSECEQFAQKVAAR